MWKESDWGSSLDMTLEDSIHSQRHRHEQSSAVRSGSKHVGYAGNGR
jgi:hypothetical protein